jgi:hypothetical protein
VNLAAKLAEVSRFVVGPDRLPIQYRTPNWLVYDRRSEELGPPKDTRVETAMAISALPAFVREQYEVHEWKHATAILQNDYPQEWQDIIAVLMAFRLRRQDNRTSWRAEIPYRQIA